MADADAADCERRPGVQEEEGGGGGEQPLPSSAGQREEEEEEAAVAGLEDANEEQNAKVTPRSVEEEGQGRVGEKEEEVVAVEKEEEEEEDVLEDSLDAGLERRPSVVARTEIVTSPGGTKSVEVALEESKPGSAGSQGSSDVSQVVEEEEEKEKGKEAKVSELDEPPARSTDEPSELDSFNWKSADQSVEMLEEPSEMDSFNWKSADQAPKRDVNDDNDNDEDKRPHRPADEEAMAAKLAAEMERESAEKSVEKSAVKSAVESTEKATEGIPEECAENQPSQNLYDGLEDLKLPPRKPSSSLLGPLPGAEKDKLLEEKDKQIESLQEQLMQVEGGERGADARDAKIVELAKKNRQLTLNLSKEEAKNRKLQEDLTKAQDKFSKQQAKGRVEREKAGAGDCDGGEGEVNHRNGMRREMQTKIAEAQHRADEMRQRCIKATNDMKKMKRILVREIGEGPDLEKVLNDDKSGTGSWRGRAQKIVLLKDKLKRAQAQLARMHDMAPADPEEPRNVDEKAQADLRGIKEERRHALERLAEDYEALEARMGETKQMANAAKARSKVLEAENKRFKEQLKVLLSKTTNDDTLVDALRREVDRLRRECADYRDRFNARERDTTSTVAYEELKQHALSQNAQIERQGQLLVKMRAEMERVKAAASRSIVQKSFEEIDAQGHAVSNQLLKVENDRLGELVDLFKQKLERAVLDRESALAKSKALERSKVELERRLTNIHTGGRKRQPRADELSEMRDKLALQAEEMRGVRASASQTIAQKDEEIKILRDMGREVKAAYERAIADMKRQVQQTAVEAQKRIMKTDSKVDDALLSQLTNDNEFLRDELHDLRGRAGGLSPTRSLSSLDSPGPRGRKAQHRLA